MSQLPPEVHQELGQLLQGLQSPDNVLRTQAEARLNDDWTLPRPEVLLMGLSEQIEGAQDPATRSFAAVLFRRISNRTRKDPSSTDKTPVTKELFLTLIAPQREAIREKLLQALNSESTATVRNKTADAVAEIARQYTDDGEQWPELLQTLLACSQSENAGLRESAFRIFSTTPGIIQKQHEEFVLGAFTAGFKDSDVSVQLAAMEAFASFFRSTNKKSQQKYYQLIPDILNILPPLKEAGDSDQLTRAFLALIDLAESSSKMFKPLFNNLVTFSVTVIQDKDLSDVARQNALELMATFAEQNPAMCRKDPTYTEEMVTQCLSLMTDVGIDDDDATEWNESEDLDVDESDANHVAGEQTMDRLANKLGGQVLLPPTFNWLPRMMQSSAWRDRHAALMAISAISEGCRDLMVGELDKVLELVLPALRDPHPRVRWAGCNAVGQMSTDFAGTMQEKYHQLVLPSIIPVLESTEPRVQAHAAAALVNFCEEAEKSVLDPYLDDLLRHLLILLQSSKRFVQEQALSTIATVADAAESAFTRYYETLMPLLLNVLQQESATELRLLRAKAMECATLIALAVGKAQMGQDAIALCNVLAQIQGKVLKPQDQWEEGEMAIESDDPQASYLLHCWGRMCRVLGMDFLPYLPGVMPPLINLAGAKADIQLLDDENTIAEVQEDEGWELVPLRGKMIGIRTSVLDDKHMAIELIVIYAQVLQAAFEPYVAEIIKRVILTGLAFFFHDPVRIASAKCVPQLLNSVKQAHGPQSPQLAEVWSQLVVKVLEVLTTEPAIESLAEMYVCFYECVEVIGKNSLMDSHMQEFVEAAKGVLEDYQTRVKERDDEANERDEGEEPGEDELYAIEDDQTLLSDMNKAFHTVFKNMTSAFLPHFEQLLPFCQQFASSPEPTQRQWAICIYDDVLEFCGPQSWNYQSYIIQPLVDGIRDDVAANRQAAIYGVGVAARYGGEVWAEFVAACLPELFKATQRPNARDDDDVFATENASATIAKILHFNAGKVANQQEVVNAWVDTLPVENDEEAAPYAYSFLAQLIDQRNPAVLNQAAKCFIDVVKALEAETLQGQNATRTVAAAKELVQITGLNAAQLLATQSPETQQTVRAFFG